jgi:ribosomal protein S18 acetylase RimI-like enzyme
LRLSIANLSPVGIVDVREARVSDAPAIAGIHVRAWQLAYRGVLSDQLLDGLSVAERASSWRELLSASDDRWLTLVAQSSRGLVGFCSVAMRSQNERVIDEAAEVRAFYVDPSQWRQGVGSAMLARALNELIELGSREVVLWVLPENHSARAFYHRFGFKVEDGVERREERSGRPVIRLRTVLAADGGHIYS